MDEAIRDYTVFVVVIFMFCESPRLKQIALISLACLIGLRIIATFWL